MSEEIDDIEENGGVEEGAPEIEENDQGSHELEAEESGDTVE